VARGDAQALSQTQERNVTRYDSTREAEAAAGHISAEEFVEIHAPDTVRLELDEGELVVSPHNTWEHQHSAKRLLLILDTWARRTGAGDVMPEMDVRLGGRSVRTPDLVFLRSDQRGLIRRHYIDGGPALVIEVMSESTAQVDRGKKSQQYAAAGVAQYWLIDPAQNSIEVFENRQGRFEHRETVSGTGIFRPAEMPGLEIPLAELWLDWNEAP
jgi:Uma2 family endonuclease